MTADEPSILRPPDAPPVFVHDPAELDRLAARAEKTTRRFRRWVRAECSLPDEDLEARVRAAADQVWRGISCLDCGKCCYARNITVDDADVRRLSAFLGMKEAAFCRRYVRTVDGEPAIAAGPCPFLDDTACTVYAARPTACRDFPFLHACGFRKRILYLMDLAHLCPIVYATLEELKATLPWRRRQPPDLPGE